MKKTLLIIGILATLISMPVMTAFQISEKTTNFPKPETILAQPNEQYDGTFIGGIGQIYQEDDEWIYDASGYIAGVYKGGNYKRVFAKIYNLDEEQVGSMWFITGNRILVGRIMGMDENKAPIVGFFFYNEQYFVGRIMSFFGPAPHIWGEYTPN
jgi:hypothetical protein